MADPMASPSRVKNPYLNHRTFRGSRELIARRMSLASPLPSLHAAFPAVLPATGPTLAPALTPALAAFLFRAMHYLHLLRGVGLSKQRDTPKGPFGNSAGTTRSHAIRPGAAWGRGLASCSASFSGSAAARTRPPGRDRPPRWPRPPPGRPDPLSPRARGP